MKAVLFIRYSPDGRFLASSSADTTTRLWDAATGTALGRLEGHVNTINRVVFSPDNSLLASCSSDATVLLWDLATQGASVLRSHSNSVNSVAFSPDSELLASCSEDATIRLWNRRGDPCGLIDGNRLHFNSVSFSSDARSVVWCSADGKVGVCGREDSSIHGSFDVGIALRQVSFSSCGTYVETDRGDLDIKLLGDTALPSLPSSSPGQPHTFFVSGDWLRRDNNGFLWLPLVRHATCTVLWEDMVVLGHSSGAISFIHA